MLFMVLESPGVCQHGQRVVLNLVGQQAEASDWDRQQSCLGQLH